jgi:Zn-dependent alcohol dehydrogenase
VSLSFSSCGDCEACATSHPAYCHNFSAVNYGAAIAYERPGADDLAGYFFGQSSFASFSNVHQRSVVNISKWVSNERDMYTYAALGCSFQSGSATVTKLAGIGKGDSIVIMGMGAVGLSAVMVSYFGHLLYGLCLSTLARLPSRSLTSQPRLLKCTTVPPS